MTYRVVAIGEALWDVFPDERRPGGAPCNVAYHASRLGDHGAIITRVGIDKDGEELTAFLDARGVDISCVQRDRQHPTGTVEVTFADGEPRYRIVEEVAWDYLEPAENAIEMVQKADAICFGSLMQRSPKSRGVVRELLREAHGRALVVFDVNLRPPFVDAGILRDSFKRSNVVKMSASEVKTVSELLEKPKLTNWLLDDVGVDKVCTTYGKDGAAIATRAEQVSVPGVNVETDEGDFVGVGDAFIAAMTHRLVRDADPEAALAFANRYAALVATRRGAMPKLSDADIEQISA